MIKKYKDIEYIIFLNNITGTFCGYVRIPDDHPDNKKVDKKEVINLQYSLAKMKGSKTPRNKENDKVLYTGYSSMNIDCHGGLTFSRRVTLEDFVENSYPQKFSVGAWIGWDYAHFGDKINMPIFSEEYRKMTENDKAWTYEEVEQECKDVIKQLLKI